MNGNKQSLAQEVHTSLPEHLLCYKELLFLKKYEFCQKYRPEEQIPGVIA